MSTEARRKKVAVIGAGASGLPSIKSCLEEGLDVVCFEKADSIGGIWQFREGQPCSLTPGTLMNTNKRLGAYSDFPAPADFPTYLPHRQSLEYLAMYADHFGLRPHVRLGHTVTAVSPLPDGRWEIRATGPDGIQLTEVADGVMVCVGHDNIPEIPDLPGVDIFGGKVIHSQEYLNAKHHEGERVLIVGNGNTAGDIANELSHTADKIYMSSRTGFVVIPRFVPSKENMATDDNFKRRYSCYLDPYLPHCLKWYLFQRDMNPQGRQITFNMKPHERPMEHKIVINDHLSDLITSGRVQLKGGVRSFSKKGVVLDDEEVEIDTVIFATGYQVTLPFLPEKYIDTEYLYKLITPVDLPSPTLGIIGMINALGPFFPLMEMQARWFVQAFLGNIKLPSQEKMLAERKETLDAMSNQKQYGRWQNLCIEPISYTDGLARQIKACPNQGLSLLKDPALYVCCNFGPALPVQYRLRGPHPWGNARTTILNHPCNQWIPHNFNQLILLAALFCLIALVLAVF